MKKQTLHKKTAVITAALTLEGASFLREKLLDAFSSHERVVFRPESVQRGSFGCVQLLHAAHQHANALGRQFVLDGPEALVVEEMFRDAGFNGLFGSRG